MTNFFNRITGIYTDQYFAALGFTRYRIRYDGTEVSPIPFVSDRSIAPVSDGTEFTMAIAENLKTYGATIPFESLENSLGANWRDACQVDAVWEISDDSGTTWQEVRVYGEVNFSRGDRCGMNFAVLDQV